MVGSILSKESSYRGVLALEDIPADSISGMLVQQDLFDAYRSHSAEKRKHVPGGFLECGE